MPCSHGCAFGLQDFPVVSVFNGHETSNELLQPLIKKCEVLPRDQAPFTTNPGGPLNFVVSTNVSDDQFICDAPLKPHPFSCDCGCDCGCNGDQGAVPSEGKSFPGLEVASDANRDPSAVPDSFPGALSQTPHPALRISKPVTDLHVRIVDVTHPEKSKLLWDAKFRLAPPLGEDGTLANDDDDVSGDPGSTELPGDLKPVGGDVPIFQKFCSKINAPHVYKMTVEAGGGHPLDETLRLKAGIYRVVPSPESENEGRINDIRSSEIKQNLPRLKPLNISDRAILISPEPLHRTSITSTSSAFCPMKGNCGCPKLGGVADPPIIGPCYAPPTVTIHEAREYSKFL